jgi:hypothetical protein
MVVQLRALVWGVVLSLAAWSAHGQAVQTIPPGTMLGVAPNPNSSTAVSPTQLNMQEFPPINFACNTFGYEWTAVCNSSIANAPANFPPQVSGGITGPALATNPGRDSVATFNYNTNPAPVVTVSSANYTATTLVPSSDISVANLKVGMIIDTLHSPKYSGNVESWAPDGSSITVNGWWQQGNTASGQVPANGIGAYVGVILGIWAENSVVDLEANGSGSASAEAGHEIDVINNLATYVHNENPALDYPQATGITSVGAGTYQNGNAFLQTGNFYYGFNSHGAGQAGFAVTSNGGQNPLYGFTYNVTNGMPFRAYDPSTGNPYFQVAGATGNLSLGEGTANSLIDFYAELSGSTPVRDARILAASGGLLDIRAAVIALQDGVGDDGFIVQSVAGSVNYLQATPAITANYPTLDCTGTDTIVGCNFLTKGSGLYTFSTGNGAQFKIADGGASTVDYLTAEGATTGGYVSLSAGGSDTTVGLSLISKGNGLICLGSFTCGGEAVRITPATSITSSIRIAPATSGVAGTITMGGSSNNSLTISAGSGGTLTVGGSGGPLVAGAPVTLPTYTVASLPTCSTSVNYNAMAAVSDSTTPTYNGALTGSSTNHIPVFCNGTAWVAH